MHDLPTAFDYYKVLPGQGKYFDPEFFEIGIKKKFRMKGHSSDCIMDSALTWFEEKRDPSQPFFLKLHFKAPHDYFENAPRYDSYLEEITMPEPLSLWSRGNGSIATRGHDNELQNIIGTSIGRRNFRRSYDADWEIKESLTDDHAKREAYNVYLKKYFRCVKGVDDNLGRLFDYLEKNNLTENTLIVYTGDQGFFLGEHDFQDKRWAYEPSLRMPLIISYPKNIPNGTRSDAIIENIDFPAMMIDFAGGNVPDYMQGKSFKSILESGMEPVDWKQEAYYQYWMHMAHHDVPSHIAMRTKRYKLILFYGTSGHEGFRSERSKLRTPPAWELYDLENDPHETNNVYADPAYKEIIKNLKSRFRSLRSKALADKPEAAANQVIASHTKEVNKVINEFWDYSLEDYNKAIKISNEYAEQFSDPLKYPAYEAPWLRPGKLDPSEM